MVALLNMSCCAPIGCIQNRFFNTYWDAPEFAFPGWYLTFVGVSMALALIATALLITAGAALIACHPASRKLHLLYACLMVGLSAADALIVWVGLGAAVVPGDLHASLSIGAFIGLIWATVYPVFLLCWFARRGVRSEVTSWAEARRQGKRPA